MVIPAHNEERGILRTLACLHEGMADGELDVVVVCNGCTDDTASVVRSAYPAVRVLEIPQPSKADAVAVGNAATDVFPRVHLDADVHLSGQSLRALVEPVAQGLTHAAAPRRVLATEGSARLVRWYYDVWQRLPQVRDGLFGRGVFALSTEGQRRVSELPRLMSDDLAASEAFAPGERLIVASAEVVVVPPRTLRDLMRRRVRVATGNAQASAAGARSDSSATSVSVLSRMAFREPGLTLPILVFLGVAVVARLQARRAVRAGDFTTWLRDESSRA